MNKIYINKKPAIQVQYHGQVVPGYYITTSGDVYSVKRSIPKKKQPFVIGRSNHQYYRHNLNTSKGMVVRAHLHQLVLHSWRPLDEYPELIGIQKKLWDTFPLHVRNLIRRGLFVNHKNHQKFDNHLKNLEYVTPQENSVKAKRFYAA